MVQEAPGRRSRNPASSVRNVEGIGILGLFAKASSDSPSPPFPGLRPGIRSRPTDDAHRSGGSSFSAHSGSPHGPSQDPEARQLKPRQAADLFLLGLHLLEEAIECFVVVHVQVEETVVRLRPSLASCDEFLRKRKVFVLAEFADRIGEGRHAVVDVDVEKRLTFHGTVLEEPPLVTAACAACACCAASSGEEKGRCDASTTHLRPTIIASSRPIHPLCART